MKYISKTLTIETCKLDFFICKYWVWIMFKHVKRMHIFICGQTVLKMDRDFVLSVVVSSQSNFLRNKEGSLSRSKHTIIYMYVRLKFKNKLWFIADFVQLWNLTGNSRIILLTMFSNSTKECGFFLWLLRPCFGRGYDRVRKKSKYVRKCVHVQNIKSWTTRSHAM